MNSKISEVEVFEVAVLERAQPPTAGSFMRTNDLAGDPAKIDEALAFVRDRVYPAVKGQPGFRAISSSVQRSTGRGITATTWDSMESLQRSEAAIVDLRADGAKVSGASGVKVEVWEVAAIEVLAGAMLPS